MSERRIVQMIPAVGWQSVYVNGDGTTLVCDLVCWALVEEEDGARDIYPMDADSSGLVEEVSEAENFAGLKGPSEGEAFVKSLVEDYRERVSKKQARALADSIKTEGEK